MNSRDCDSHDGVLSRWEDEGGAPAAIPDADPRFASDDILQSLGQSVVTHWDELPHAFKQATFHEIAAKFEGRAAGLRGLKERTARFLHYNSSAHRKREGRPASPGKEPLTLFSSESPRRLGDLFADSKDGRPEKTLD